ncbi:DUF262 domain-containing protein [Hydrogenimonas cancrithermarum]|uniref:DUF262 domain-containing protein n=1 Tax=Hydrogenimonas cancrithermarum TaxID=2993563 RepID=A0ABM8FPT5_9BACT|nr:DUF262 domain-containing protein [Hydrogenimonas cancrithermarum]BDY13887.1 hypothetical protein HCR_21990 [Hydrogenimonas cancrithermarum]
MTEQSKKFQINIETICWKEIEKLKGEKNREVVFTIPVYQRRYAWKSEEVIQLLSDLVSWESDNPYFIGNIVVEKRDDGVYDIIDGQQRLTTLYLVAVMANKKTFELSYEVREGDNAFLQEIGRRFDARHVEELTQKSKADGVFKANIEAIESYISENRVELGTLLEKVKFALTILDREEVDIAKYFEVMNSRGKQLEKHQIIKANILDGLEEKERGIYARIWDYCSRMDSYVEEFIYRYIKRAYDKTSGNMKQTESMEKIRKGLIDLAFEPTYERAEKLFQKENGGDNTNTAKLSIENILSKKDVLSSSEESYEGVERYRSFLKFEYFLLHVLKLYSEEKESIEINDAKLLEQFERFKSAEKKEKKAFMNDLLAYRILYDYFVVKRQMDGDEPFFAVLETANKGLGIDRKAAEKDLKISRAIMNMQLLFNFTTDFFAQDWIYTVLKWIKSLENDVLSEKFYDRYLEFLKSLDKKAALTRLRKGDLKKMFYSYNGPPATTDGEDAKPWNLDEVLNRGTSTPHYWFYKLDYLLWEQELLESKFEKGEYEHPFSEEEKFKYEEIKKNFRLSRLNSIEHMKPQSKANDWGERCNGCKAKRSIDCFGNLALVTHHLNSSLLDDEVNKKYTIQRQLNRGTIESLKMIDFYSRIRNSQEMTIDHCREHHKEMVGILCKSLGVNGDRSCPA